MRGSVVERLHGVFEDLGVLRRIHGIMVEEPAGNVVQVGARSVKHGTQAVLLKVSQAKSV
jgi:hypothetical protein